jgi:hypothetical protein
LEDVAIDLLGTPTGQELDIIRVRCELAARKWDPHYVDCNRGRDAEVIAAPLYPQRRFDRSRQIV